MNGRLLFLAPCCLCLIVSGFAHADPTATLAAQADAVQAAGLPVIIHLAIKNMGRDTFCYTNGGPGRYPGAQLFSAALKTTAGKVYRTELMDDFLVYPYTTTNVPSGNAVEIYNGQYWRALAACVNVPINPGDVVVVPIALSPLPPGRYTLVFRSIPNLLKIGGERVPNVYWPVMTAAPIAVTVREDPALAQSAVEALAQRAQAGEPFAASVRTHFNMPLAASGISR